MSVLSSNAGHEDHLAIETRSYAVQTEVETGLEPNHHPTTVSPISKIPVELMQQIFYLCIDLTRLPEERASHHETPTCVQISHVSPRWREMAVAFADLWTTIHNRLGTPPKFVRSMWERSRDAPIDLFIDLRRPVNDQQPLSDSSSPLLDDLATKIQSSCQRFRSIQVCAPESDLRIMFSRLPDRLSLERLETLIIRTDASLLSPQWDGWDGHNLLASTAPLLRVARLDAVQLQPNSLILQSNRLSHIGVLGPQNSSYDALLAALARNHDHIQSFHLHLADRHASMVLPGVRAALSFPHLRTFLWIGTSSSWDAPIALLKHIRLNPRVLADFTLSWSDAPGFTDIHHIWYALKTSVFGPSEPIFAPEHVSFLSTGPNCLLRVVAYKYRGEESSDHDAPRPALPNQLVVTIMTRGSALFSEPSHYGDVWSFDGVKTFEAGAVMSHVLWKRMRTSATLDQLRIDRMARSRFAYIFLAGLQGLPDKTVPFPALKTLIFENTSSTEGDVHEWRRWRHSVASSSTAWSDQWDGELEFVLYVAWLLRSRRSRRLNRGAPGPERMNVLRFNGCRNDLPDRIRLVLEQEALQVFWNVVQEI